VLRRVAHGKTNTVAVKYTLPQFHQLSDLSQHTADEISHIQNE
jgi:hypothetical protein